MAETVTVDEKMKVLESEKSKLQDDNYDCQSRIDSIIPLIHIAITGIDVARQKKDICNVDNLLIHPFSHVMGDHGGVLLLEYVSEILANVVKELDPNYERYYGVEEGTKGSLE